MELLAQVAVPNPYEAILKPRLDSKSPTPSVEFSAQYRRRAEILAATRRQLAAEGYPKFTIRSISDACRLTSQTIYNSFGCKSELLLAALNQHTLMIDSLAASHAKKPAIFLMLALAYCQSATKIPDFIREYMRAAFSPKQSLRDPLHRFGVDLKTRVLRDMARQGLLRRCVDPRIAADQIAYVNTFGLYEWAENDDLPQLYRRLVLGNGAVLLGILTPEAARDIESWLNDPVNQHWTPTAGHGHQCSAVYPAS